MFWGLVTAVLGGLVVLFAGRSILHGLQSKSWPTIEGEILSSQLRESVKPNTGKKTWQAIIFYRYENTLGEMIKSDRITTGYASPGTHASQSKLIEKYPSNTTVSVFVSPDDPSFSVLQPGIAISSLMAVAIGGIMLVIGLCLIAGVITPN